MSEERKRAWPLDAPPQLLVFTGAGLSAESGIQTFRGVNGLWNGSRIEEMCHRDHWRANFDIVHEFYNMRRGVLATAKPNSAHVRLAAWQRNCPGQVHLLTQNVDNLLEQAGAQKVVHLHGFLTDMTCVACGHTWSIGATQWNTKTPCPSCNGDKDVRPAIIFFGERAPEYQTLYTHIGSLRPQDTVLVVGTSGTVLDPVLLFCGWGARTFFANLEPAPAVDGQAFDVVAYGPATEAVAALEPQILARLTGSL